MQIRRVIVFLLAIYFLLIASVEISIVLGLRPSLILTPLGDLVGFSIAILHAGERLGWKRAMGLLACVFVTSLTFESVGVATGLIYGPYHYTSKLGPLIFGLVPPLIPVVWFLMMYPSFIIADWLIPVSERGRNIPAMAAVGGVIMTAWDLVMDPLMTNSKHWVWDVEGAYFGVPLQNFFGWWLTTFAALLLFLWLAGRALPPASDGKFDRQVVILYTLTALGSTVSALFKGLGGPALAGILAMLPWVMMGWTRMKV